MDHTYRKDKIKRMIDDCTFLKLNSSSHKPNILTRRRRIFSNHPNSILKQRIIKNFEDLKVGAGVCSDHKCLKDGKIITNKAKLDQESATNKLHFINIDFIEDKEYWRIAMSKRLIEAEENKYSEEETEQIFNIEVLESKPSLSTIKFVELFGVIVPYVENYNPNNATIFKELGALLNMSPEDTKREIEAKVTQNRWATQRHGS